jgi:hypothetical protein
MNILAIGAHPDDIELGCGGVLLKAVKQRHNGLPQEIFEWHRGESGS